MVKNNTISDQEIEDLDKTAKKLQTKFTKKRKINEDLLRPKTPAQKAGMIVLDVFCVIIVMFSLMICFSAINSKTQNICPTFAGYSNLRISSGSMVASGFKVGDKISVRSVDPATLHVGDKIAFYVYPEDYRSFDINTCERIDDSTLAKNKYTMPMGTILGFQSAEIAKAAKSGSKFVFHHINAIYKDGSGKLWFSTYGSSNPANDPWYISENMVVGLYVDDGFSAFISKVLATFSSNYGIILIIIPVAILLCIVIIECFKNVQRSKLELDCIEEKRKITDDICVKNNIGLGMDTKAKFKILAQANDRNRAEYIKLLWKDGKVPNDERYSEFKKEALLTYNKNMLELNRYCENMFKKGELMCDIAKFYSDQKTKYKKAKNAESAA